MEVTVIEIPKGICFDERGTVRSEEVPSSRGENMKSFLKVYLEVILVCF